jgi:RNA polymerase sigma-70 factor (ECF subfamily)
MSDDALQPPPPEPSDRSAEPSPDRPCCGVGPWLAQLVAEYHAAVYRYAYRLSGSAADAEDLTQQTFLIAQQKLDQVREADRAGHWLLVVVRNAFLKSCRRRVPMPVGGLEIDIYSVPDRTHDTNPADSAASVLDEIDVERLQAAIDELPDEFRLPLLMFYFEDASYRDIAEQLDIPPGTVMSRLSRAKSHLRRRLLQPDTETNPRHRREDSHSPLAPNPSPTNRRSTLR